jgi:aminoglycoside phosphotransferase (APT) family kinase protein
MIAAGGASDALRRHFRRHACEEQWGLFDYGRVVPQPAPSALARAVAAAGPSAVVVSVQELLGGTHADTHLLRLSNPDLDVVLREFPIGDADAENEVHVLQALDGLDGLVPRVLDSEVDATRTTRPWVLISRLPGRAEITAQEPEARARQLGHVLARLHATHRPGTRDSRMCWNVSALPGLPCMGQPLRWSMSGGT